MSRRIEKPDVLILGSGFGGSLLALILLRAGKSVVLLDRQKHPRFAIGESSTPLADKTLAAVARRWSIPELLPLTHWGTWKQTYPHLLCGRKRGFTYFDQTDLTDVSPASFDHRRLLVSASVDNEHSDTHWLRSDVDQFLFQLAQQSGAVTFEGGRYELQHGPGRWVATGTGADTEFFVDAPFAVDATGSGGGLLKFLGIPDQTQELRTNSRSVFAHFADTQTCEQLLRASRIDVERFPFACDDAAVHQVLPDGWMWQLRYDDNSLSAGFMIDQRTDQRAGERVESQTVPSTRRDRAPVFATAQDEWDWRVARSAFLSRQFAGSFVNRPASGLTTTQRIQRLTTQAAGTDWAAITNTAGFIDPLHSTGIAHTLFSVARLAEILMDDDSSTRTERLQRYSAGLIEEIRCVDELVEGCYEGLPEFSLWCLWGMLYFAAATSMEQAGNDAFSSVSFLRANDPAFRQLLREGRERLTAAKRDGAKSVEHFAEWIQKAIEPWNKVGLFDFECDNLYSSTAAPVDAW